MSALGQKQTFHYGSVMSALPPKADIRRRGLDVRFVPKADIPRDSEIFGRGPHPAELAASPRRPRWGSVVHSVAQAACLRCPTRISCIVGERKDSRWNLNTNRFCGLQVDHESVVCRLLKRQL